MMMYRTLLLSVLSAAALMVTALPAQAQVDVGVSIGFPGNYGFAGPAYGGPVYGEPRPVYVQPPPVYIDRDGGRRWHERDSYYRDRHDRHDNGWHGGRGGHRDRDWDGDHDGHDGHGGHGGRNGWRR